MKPTVTLREWSICARNPYQPPEVPPRLQGLVFGHPRHSDGSKIVTSHIVGVSGRHVETPHTIYLLEGPPAADYVAWCIEHGIQPPDPENPIRLHLMR